MTRKQFSIYMLVSVSALVLSITFLVRYFNQPAVQGEMTVVCGENSTDVLSNVFAITKDGETEKFDKLVLADVADDIPIIEVGDEFTVKYTENYLDDDMAFSMYKEDLTAMYEDTVAFSMPHEKGIYIVRFVCSWGSRDNDKITEENYFKINYNGHSHN